MNEKTFNVADAHKLEDPERLKWMPPDAALLVLSLKQGMTVADVGAGTGYFSVPLARAIGPSGKLFAVDLQPEMLEFLKDKLRQRDMPANLQLLRGTAEETGVPESSCDLVFLANVWHELENHHQVVREAARIAKREGRLAILDWRPDRDRPPGPPIEHRLRMEQVIATLEAEGCAVERSAPVGKYSYVVVAKLAKRP